MTDLTELQYYDRSDGATILRRGERGGERESETETDSID